MKKIAFSLVLVATVVAAGAQPLQAQTTKRDGPGGFLDWLHRLSGPQMFGPAGSYFWGVGEGADGNEVARIRISLSAQWPIGSEDKIDPGHTLNMVTLQPSLELPIWRSENRPVTFAINAGLGLHRFGGEGHDAVYHVSVPLMGQLRFPINREETLFLRFAGGIRYFPPFPDDAFDGGVEVQRDSHEFPVTAVVIGLDYAWR